MKKSRFTRDDVDVSAAFLGLNGRPIRFFETAMLAVGALDIAKLSWPPDWLDKVYRMGVNQLVNYPEILAALSQHHERRFLWEQPGTTFIILGSVVLCVTGAEALYADLGQYGKKPIRLAWFLVGMPCDWALPPLVLLCTMATMIASQALITGAFSVTKQAMQLG